jgi:hypothetical protein
VVEHEAKTVKRRATLALAHDVKTWNIHRKREMLRSCISYAKSQHEACRRAVDSWSSLADGFIGSSSTPTTVDRRHVAPVTLNIQSEPKRPPRVDPDEVSATIFDSVHNLSGGTFPHIVAVDHNVLSSVSTSTLDLARTVEGQSPETFLPSCDVAPIPEEEDEEAAFFVFPELMGDAEPHEQNNSTRNFEINNTEAPQKQGLAGDTFIHDFFDFNPTDNTPIQHDPTDCFSPMLGFDDNFTYNQDAEPSLNAICHPRPEDPPSQDDDVVGDLRHFKRGHVKHDASVSEEVLSESMQSLVEGLMSWGGGFDVEEEHFALPPGMAASIVLEGSTTTGGT